MSNKPISIGGRAIKAQHDGGYLVHRRLLRGQDLRLLPPDTELIVEPPASAPAPVTIIAIQGPDPGGFRVRIGYSRNPMKWVHSLDYNKYMNAVGELLVQAASAGIDYEESFDFGGVCGHFFWIIRPENTIEDIQAAVDHEVNNILSPLDQFVAQLNQQVKQQFNV
jgi:hypothetical protein